MLVNSQIQMTDKDGTADIAVASTGTVYTKSLDLGYKEYFALFLTATSSGTVNVVVTLEQSYRTPRPEGVADTEWVAPEGASTIITLSDENSHITPISSMKALPYFRLKLVGDTGNDASTTVNIRLGYVDNV